MRNPSPIPGPCRGIQTIGLNYIGMHFLIEYSIGIHLLVHLHQTLLSAIENKKKKSHCASRGILYYMWHILMHIITWKGSPSQWTVAEEHEGQKQLCNWTFLYCYWQNGLTGYTTAVRVKDTQWVYCLFYCCFIVDNKRRMNQHEGQKQHRNFTLLYWQDTHFTQICYSLTSKAVAHLIA